MLYRVIDDYAPKELYEHISGMMYADTFPWYYHDYVAYVVSDVEKNKEDSDEFYFTHTFYGDKKSDTPGINSNYFDDIIVPLCFILLGKDVPLIRAKANLFTKRENTIKYGMHTDYNFDEHTTWVYSLNSNNGYTEFEDGTKIPSVANQLLIFDGNIPHRSVGQTDTRKRINLNINLKIKPEILCKS